MLASIALWYSVSILLSLVSMFMVLQMGYYIDMILSGSLLYGIVKYSTIIVNGIVLLLGVRKMRCVSVLFIVALSLYVANIIVCVLPYYYMYY